MLSTWLTDTVTRDLDRALHYTLLWGLDGVELRTLGGPMDRIPFVNEEKLKRRMAEHDVPVVAVVPGLFEGAVADRAGWLNEIALLDETLRFCSRVGCPQVIVSAFDATGRDDDATIDALRRAGTAAGQRGIRLAVLNETEMAYATGASMAELLGTVDHPSVQAAWDPVAAVQAGEEPQAGLAALAGRVALVRCHNIAHEGGTWVAATLDDGVVDWSAHLRLLHAQGFDGPVSLEVHLDPAPKQGLRMATGLIRLIRSAKAP